MHRSEATALFSVPESEAERTAVREQLERILASPLFRNSKRYPSLLRYVVEQSIEGHGSELKERTLGIEVFSRTPDYDTNLDPVVRISAAEIRKRIAQYYHEPGREGELRIDLPLGSYVPEFRMPVARPRTVEVAAPVALVPLPEVVPIAAPGTVVRERESPWKTVSAVLAIALIAMAVAWWRPWIQPSALDRFWAPVMVGDKTVLLCIGRVHDPDGRPRGVPLSDATAMSRLTGVLQSHGQPFAIRAEDLATFGDLRQNPVVLIGAFNDSWSLRLANSGRYTLHQAGDVDWIQDQQNPSARSWSVARTGDEGIKEDFGLISRVIDPATDRIMVMVGGLRGYGTLAAGEFLSNAKYMAVIAQQAPAGWQKKNLQIVISTEVIKGNSGPPKVLAFYAW
jgi:hypothetical protein